MRLATVILVTAVLTSACGDPQKTTGAGGRSTTITVGNNFFAPNPDTVPVGWVSFEWDFPGSAGHNVTWMSGPAPLPPGLSDRTEGTYQLYLETPGTYRYRCTRHATMNAVLVAE